MRSPKFVIHIGPHKTGTTYLQASFHGFDHELDAQHICYPKPWMGHDTFSHVRLVEKLSRLDYSVREEFEELFAAPWKIVLISAEDMTDLNLESILFLKEMLGQADAEIVFYCRRWSQLLFSCWQETLKYGQFWTFPEFAAGHLGNPFGSSIINYSLALDKYAKAFGAASLRIVSYTDLVESQRDIFCDFASKFLGIENSKGLSFKPNVSMTAECAEIVRAVNEIHRVRDNIQANCYESIANCFAEKIRHLTEFMRYDIRSLVINEGVPGLSTVHDAIFSAYGNCLVERKSNSKFFVPTMAKINFPGPGYLHFESAYKLIRSLYDDVRQSASHSENDT